MADFAPTPMHGAAYAVAIETVGGVHAVASCATMDRYREHRAVLDELGAWAFCQTDAAVRAAYHWGVQKVDADLKSRVAVFENSRAVNQALADIPRPPRPDQPRKPSDA